MPRQVRAARVQDEVVVVAHQTVCKHLRIEALQALLDDGQELSAVLIVGEYAFAPVTTRSDMVDGTWELNAKWS